MGGAELPPGEQAAAGRRNVSGTFCAYGCFIPIALVKNGGYL